MSNSAISSSQPKRRRGNVREPTHLSLLRQLNDDKKLVVSNFQVWANRVDDLDEKESLLKMIPDLESAHELIEKLLFSVGKRDPSVSKQFSEFWSFFNGSFNKDKFAKYELIAGIFKSIEGKMGEAEKEFEISQSSEEPPAKKRNEDNNKVSEVTTTKDSEEASNERHLHGAPEVLEDKVYPVLDVPEILTAIRSDLEGYKTIIEAFQSNCSLGNADIGRTTAAAQVRILDFLTNLENNFVGDVTYETAQKLNKIKAMISLQTPPVAGHWVALVGVIETMFATVNLNWKQIDDIFKKRDAHHMNREVSKKGQDIRKILDNIRKDLESFEKIVMTFQENPFPNSGDIAKTAETVRTRHPIWSSATPIIPPSSYIVSATGVRQKPAGISEAAAKI
ncbi:hypothetical protein B9Z55_027331 [Caenorhabditis nigoni]|uniref:Uncharacterized protein n=1 Tax=Caenorhabditis nigoni TaxID=1611254 RepID=A0A2G5SG49_9PELO|nr:hypothetical protein B9Z55_027331 [Caenorhabditis nigoni]